MDIKECSICCENFNKSNRLKIQCKTCEDDNETFACRTCAKRYILDNNEPPSCMVCNIKWDTESLCEYFPKCFINKELKKHTENYLFEKQIALLPSTQKFAEQKKKIKDMKLKQYSYAIKIGDLRTAIVDLKEEINECYNLHTIYKNERDNDKSNEMLDHIRNYNNKISDLNKKIKNYTEMSRAIDINSRINTDNTKTFTVKCPIENCNGFLDENYECGICNNKICKDCMEIKGKEHICNEEKKETVKFLKKDTKGCPTCGQLIYKIDGCDQMYCIKCHTAFSWKTGKIEYGTVHNPEYFRWMRENNREIPRNPLDIVDIVENDCNNTLLPYHRYLQFLRQYYPCEDNGISIIDQDIVIAISNMYSTIRHANHLDTLFNIRYNNENNMFRELRVSYMLNEITMEEFKVKLQRYEKQKEKEEKINNVWALLRIVLLEYLLKITEKQHSIPEGKHIIEDTIDKAENIRVHCNESFVKISKMYNSKPRNIHPFYH